MTLLDRVAETADRTWSATAHLAAQHRLTSYDAAYLELSLRLGLPLATSDKPLIQAARQVGIEILPTA